MAEAIPSSSNDVENTMNDDERSIDQLFFLINWTMDRPIFDADR